MSVADWLLVLGSFLGFFLALLIGICAALLIQFERRLDTRFMALDEQRKQGQEAWKDVFQEHVRNDERELGEISANITALSADLGRHYVRREELRDRRVGGGYGDLDEKIDLILQSVNRWAESSHD